MNDISKNFTCNESIKEKEVRVIDAEGNQLGILQTKEAQRMADESELDVESQLRKMILLLKLKMLENS